MVKIKPIYLLEYEKKDMSQNITYEVMKRVARLS